MLGQRSRFPFIRKSLNAFSLLPIITPPFILAFSMIFMLGRRGIVTYDPLFAFVCAMTAISEVIFVVSSGNQLTTVLLLG